MARPTKYNEKTVEGVVELIKQGYNLKAVAKAFNVSEASLSRWRERYPNFNKAVVLATREQNAKTYRLSDVRPYKRKAYISPQYNPKPLTDSQVLPKEGKAKLQHRMWRGLPIKPRPLEYEPTGYYVNPQTERVERIDENGVLHSCPMWVWEEKHRQNYSPFICDNNLT